MNLRGYHARQSDQRSLRPRWTMSCSERAATYAGGTGGLESAMTQLAAPVFLSAKSLGHSDLQVTDDPSLLAQLISDSEEGSADFGPDAGYQPVQRAIIDELRANGLHDFR